MATVKSPAFFKDGTAMRSIVIGAIVVCMAAMAPGEVVTIPGQAAVQGINGWTVDVVFEQPQKIVLRLAGDTEETSYWYVILSLTNKTGQEASFYPDCDLMTDTYQLVRASAGVRGEVYDRIREKYRQAYPFLEPLEKAAGKLQQGGDHTKDVLLVWKDFDKDARSIKLFIGGLSNETKTIEKPTAAGAPAEQVVLRKTLELNYTISGDSSMRTNGSLVYKGRNWVMR
jgi:hypothetical protein